MNNISFFTALILVFLVSLSSMGQKKNLLDSEPFELIPKDLATMSFDELQDWYTIKADNDENIFFDTYEKFIDRELFVIIRCIKIHGNGLVEYLHLSCKKGENKFKHFSIGIESTYTFFNYDNIYSGVKPFAKKKKVKGEYFWLDFFWKCLTTIEDDQGTLNEAHFSKSYEFYSAFFVGSNELTYSLFMDSTLGDNNVKRQNIKLFIHRNE